MEKHFSYGNNISSINNLNFTACRIETGFHSTPTMRHTSLVKSAATAVVSTDNDTRLPYKTKNLNSLDTLLRLRKNTNGLFPDGQNVMKEDSLLV